MVVFPGRPGEQRLWSGSGAEMPLGHYCAKRSAACWRIRTSSGAGQEKT